MVRSLSLIRRCFRDNRSCRPYSLSKPPIAGNSLARTGALSLERTIQSTEDSTVQGFRPTASPPLKLPLERSRRTRLRQGQSTHLTSLAAPSEGNKLPMERSALHNLLQEESRPTVLRMVL